MNRETEALIGLRATYRAAILSSDKKSGDAEEAVAENSLDEEVVEKFRQELRQLNWGGTNQGIQIIYQYHDPQTV